MRLFTVLIGILSVGTFFPPALCAQVFEAPVAYPTGAPAPNGVALSDLNGDGKLEVVIANAGQSGTIAVLLGNGDGTLQPAITYPAGSYPEFVVLADFNKMATSMLP